MCQDVILLNKVVILIGTKIVSYHYFGELTASTYVGTCQHLNMHRLILKIRERYNALFLRLAGQIILRVLRANGNIQLFQMRFIPGEIMIVNQHDRKQ